MQSQVSELKILIKKGQFGKAFIKILTWLSNRIDLLLLRFFSLFPIRDLLVFHSTSDFSDNARAFYDYLIEHEYNKKHKIVWILSDTNPREYTSPRNVKFVKFRAWHPVVRKDYYCAVAKCFIFTHGPGVAHVRNGQTLIHTSHSASRIKAPKTVPGGENGAKKDYSLVCGQDGLKKRKITLGMNESQLPILGMPRLDLLYRDNKCLSKLLNNYNGEHIILAMETFKQSRYYIDTSSNDDIYAINVVHSKEELKALDVCLKKYNAVLFIKIHPYQDLNYLSFVQLENIFFLTNAELDTKNVQLYELVKNTDILLTDYSSIFYDFLLLNRPIGFMLGDMDQYDRGFFSDDPLEDMTGEKLYTLKDLEKFIEESLTGIDRYAEARKQLRDQVFTYQDGNNCKRLYEWMKEKNIIS